ncbi:hypothetical protein [Dapis sp. BLCC M229]|uniref:hypothetical protein n=1 Tax=Dapis sp. BLCC M229 TaxID=3400188 RepID=UPI003CEF678E
MIQELEDLKNSILEQRYEDALTLIYELYQLLKVMLRFSYTSKVKYLPRLKAC